jgi:integrase
MRTRLAFVKAYRDRHGKARYYFRRKGRRDVALPGKPRSAEFKKAYREALNTLHSLGAARSLPGSLSAAIAAYYQDQRFRVLAESTQGMRRRILEKLRSKFGQEPIKDLTRGHVVSVILAPLPPFERNNYLKSLRGLMKFAAEHNLIDADPTIGIKMNKGGGSIHTWDETEIAQYRARHGLGSTPRLALELLLNLAQRRSDVHKLGPQHLNAGAICVRQKKSKMEKNDRALVIPVLPELQEALDKTPTGQLVFLVRRDGQPFTEKGFGTRFREWCDQAGLPQCSAHGLRKAGLVRLAESGASEREMMAISGHRNPAELRPYLEAVDQKKLAASGMAKLRENKDRTEPLEIGRAARTSTKRSV